MKPIYFTLIVVYTLICGNIIAQPINDDCANAITVGFSTDHEFSTINATTDGPEHPTALCYGNGGDFAEKEVWYKVTAENTGHIEFSLCNSVSFDTRIAVYMPGASCPPVDADLLSCNDDGENCFNFSSKTTFPCTAGETYLLCIGGYADDETGSGTFSLQEIVPEPAPENSNCADSQTLTVVTASQAANDEGLIFGTTVNAISAFPGPTCNPTGEYNDVWYNFNTNGSTEIEVETEILTTNALFHVELWENDCSGVITDGPTVSCWGQNEFTQGFIMTGLPDVPTDYKVRIATRITDQTAGDFSIQLVGNAVTSIDVESLDAYNLTIFPNPADNLFTIETSTDVMDSQLTILDMQGRSVYTENLSLIKNKKKSISIENLSSGMYMVAILDGNNHAVTSQKLMVR